MERLRCDHLRGGGGHVHEHAGLHPLCLCAVLQGHDVAQADYGPGRVHHVLLRRHDSHLPGGEGRGTVRLHLGHDLPRADQHLQLHHPAHGLLRHPRFPAGICPHRRRRLAADSLHGVRAADYPLHCHGGAVLRRGALELLDQRAALHPQAGADAPADGAAGAADSE